MSKRFSAASSRAAPSMSSNSRPDSTSDMPFGGLYRDPRSSSSQSLLPEYEGRERRKLLIVYVHGFMGNETSFQSFPAHVHRYLKLALSDTHVIHTKIYPRYKTYKAIEVARDNFSRWLAPHESPTTDVVLVGHSMGGLLAADVVLMPSDNTYSHRYFRHRILGTVNLDAPLLGLHPGIIVSGISSLFRKNEAPKLPGEPSSSDPSASPGVPAAQPAVTFDPNFNPNFVNDIRLQDRGWWRNMAHFAKKHSSEGLVDAATKHIMSHLEFGSCLMDLGRLKNRYENVRKLEDIDDLQNRGLPHAPSQVRFVQYYTVCYGYPKKPKQKDGEEHGAKSISQSSRSASPSTSRMSVEEQSDALGYTHSLDATPTGSATHTIHLDQPDVDDENSEMQVLDPTPMYEEYEEAQDHDAADHTAAEDVAVHPTPSEPAQAMSAPDTKSTGSEAPADDPPAYDAGTAEVTESVSRLDLDLPSIPDLPPKPDPPDLEKFTDKDARKLAEKEGKRAQKAYDQAVKDREKAVKERQKIIDKRKKKVAQEAEKREKEAAKRAKEAEKKRQKGEAAAAATATAEDHPTPLATPEEGVADMATPDPGPPFSAPSEAHLPASPAAAPRPAAGKPKAAKKPRKERKFCTLPKQPDPAWVKIFMRDMDEVGAHTGLFFAGDHYERLVGDVGDTVARWVMEDLNKRAVLELEGSEGKEEGMRG
ncbi:hypothetical protein F4780DRAFT_56999 [Xylariomycetidae sp. FL0641]|nr:hypothetical protein F4780DRAFT_56999 [Xylariomycetidae sp. FL0641]